MVGWSRRTPTGRPSTGEHDAVAESGRRRVVTTARVCLASRSPRRRALLEQIGVACVVVDPSIDESLRPGESPRELVVRLARGKALAGRELPAAAGMVVVAADTEVVLDDAVLGKPADAADAEAMLARLSGRAHEVLSAVAVLAPDDAEPRVRVSASRVWFRPTTAAERKAYCATGEPLDKAGAYGIQGRAAVFVERLDGSYSGVMGLPLHETATLLARAGIDVLG
ncbi:MAG: septum formation inhibitor Maf [Ectothiorhodospiraceae bacterium]|nr:septum formation inhibitor Maf [Ectothiorhodospiraceae bacterium]